MNNIPGSTCPVCEGWSTEEEDSYYSGTSLTVKYKCYDCGSEWNDVYKYDSSKITKEGN